MKLKKTQKVVGIGILSALAGITLTATAGGFQLHEENVTNLGNAYAGTGAQADDASTEWFNPAGMTRIQNPQIVTSGTFIDLDANVNVKTATSTALVPPIEIPLVGPINLSTFTAVSGKNNEDIGKPAVVPSFHFVYPFLNNKWAFGFGVNAPFGLQTEYSNDSIARYLATDSKIVVVDITPSLAYQITQQLSIGAGIDAQYLDATFDQMVPGIRFNPIPLILPNGAVGPDGEFDNEADGWGWGWHAGLLFQFNPCTRLGLSYHSRVNHNISGDASLGVNVPPFPVVFPNGRTEVFKGTITADATLPDYADLDFYHDINSQWAFLAGVEYTHWSLIDSITAHYSGAIANNDLLTLSQADLPFHFKNTWRVSTGLNFKPTDRWTLKTGIAYDESPVSSAENRTFRLPDSDRYWIGLGAQYIINCIFTVDAGYTHLFIKDDSINNTQTFFPTFFAPIPVIGTEVLPTVLQQHGVADVRASANEVGLQLTINLRSL